MGITPGIIATAVIPETIQVTLDLPEEITPEIMAILPMEVTAEATEAPMEIIPETTEVTAALMGTPVETPEAPEDPLEVILPLTNPAR